MDNQLVLLFWLCVAITVIILYKYLLSRQPKQEGFTQDTPFLSVSNNVYQNDFYVSMYDRLNKTRQQSKFDIVKIIEYTQPAYNSVFLDIGSGTGQIVSKLNQHGYNAFGIDSSTVMVDYASSRHTDSEYKCGDALDTMTFEPNTFSYILCTYFTFYEIENHDLFFKNCSTWLKPSGKLIVHLVDKKNFSCVTPLAKTKAQTMTQSNSETRITNTKLDMDSVIYKSEVSFLDSGITRVAESFVNKSNGYKKHYERNMRIDAIEDTVKLASKYGFVVKAYVSYEQYNGDSNQFLYIFERIDV